MATLDFWFDFTSTYSYPAAMRVEEACAAAGVSLAWKPVLLGPIFAAQGYKGAPFSEYPIKGQYMWRDLDRICAALGIGFRQPSVFPRPSVLGARMAFAHRDEPWVGSFIRALYTQNFALDQDIGTEDAVRGVLEDLGIEADAALARALSDQTKAAFRAQVDHALTIGLFGAPTMFVGSEMFWGNDRLDMAIAEAAR